MKKFLLLALLAGTLVTSCKKDNEEKDGIFKGPVTKVYDGKAWTWIQLDKQGNPMRLAVTLTDEALNSVPMGHDDDGDGDHAHEIGWNLQFHPKASITPFKYLAMGWNPHGHEPEIFYGKPHFDFHFYMMSQAEVAAIPPYEVDSAGHKNWPAPAYFPPFYFNTGGGVPQMGTHWVDPTSGEFNGQGFTQTFIYGSYNGKVNFYEPMITWDFLKNSSTFQRQIPQPAKVQQSGFYPTLLEVVKHDGVTEIVLDAFVYRTKS
jgi:hypothetical protein